MTVLASYTGGQWRAPSGEGAPLHDAVTGDEVARISSDGIDKAAALDYGRAVGGPALRELTFHQRAAILKSLGSYLREHREELYALSARTGALRWPAHLHSRAWRCGTDQRVQLPGVGTAGEARACVYRRGSEPDQAGQPDRLPDREAGGADRGLRAAAGRLDPAHLRRRGRPARPPHRAGSGVLHRLGVHGPAAAGAPGGRRQRRSVQRRGRLAQPVHPRP